MAQKHPRRHCWHLPPKGQIPAAETTAEEAAAEVVAVSLVGLLLQEQPYSRKSVRYSWQDSSLLLPSPKQPSSEAERRWNAKQPPNLSTMHPSLYADYRGERPWRHRPRRGGRCSWSGLTVLAQMTSEKMWSTKKNPRRDTKIHAKRLRAQSQRTATPIQR